MHEIQKIEHEGILVLTTQQIAESYGVSVDTITKNYNRNKDRYIEGKHFICLKGDELREFKANGQIDLLPNVNTLYLWTQKGTFLHAKSLNTDKAWEVYDRLVDSYFSNRSPQIDTTQLSPQLQMFQQIFQTVANQELEQKRQAEKIEQIEKKQDTLTETFVKTSDAEDFQKWCKNCVGKIANSTFFMNCFPNADRLRYEKVWQESYERLNQKRTCRLNQRVAYARGMALKNGATKSQADKISILYVISADNDLKPIYETVIKEMMICYCV